MDDWFNEAFEIRYDRLNVPNADERAASAAEYSARQLWEIRRSLERLAAVVENLVARADR